MRVFSIWAVIQLYFRPFIKWFLRKTTRLCELQRICNGDKPGAVRTCKVEDSLMLSRTTDVKEVVSFLDNAVYERRFVETNLNNIMSSSVGHILRVKKIDSELHGEFVVSFRKCLEQIWSYRNLLDEVEVIWNTQFDTENPDHADKILKLWLLLVPNEDLESRVTKRWQYIGFQGDDPKTDLRGMGMLALENLLYFAMEYPKASSHILSHSHHLQHGYTYVSVGTNLTTIAYSLLNDGSAKTFMFNAKRYLPNMTLFHKFYCYLFYKLDEFWIRSQQSQDLMDLSLIFTRFQYEISYELTNTASVLRLGKYSD